MKEKSSKIFFNRKRFNFRFIDEEIAFLKQASSRF